MYVVELPSGYMKGWNKDGELAKGVIEEIVGDVDGDDFPVEVDRETAREISEKYRELTDSEDE